MNLKKRIERLQVPCVASYGNYYVVNLKKRIESVGRETEVDGALVGNLKKRIERRPLPL